MNTIRPSTSFRNICRAIGACFLSDVRHSFAFSHSTARSCGAGHYAGPFQVRQLGADRLVAALLVTNRLHERADGATLSNRPA